MNGTLYSYFFICKRKLWFFANHIKFENYNEDVRIGKQIDEQTYCGEHRGLMIDGNNKIDFIDGQHVLHEVKKSKSIDNAHVAQAKYYAYMLRKSGGIVEKIVINYPELNQKYEYVLTEDDYKEVEDTILQIETLLKSGLIPSKPERQMRICKACAYYEFCYI